MKRKALIIAYYFPPIACSGTIRTLKFVKYLERHGWSCVVVTVDGRYEHVEARDEALTAQVPPSTTVLRTYAWHPRNLVRRISTRESTAGSKNPASGARPSSPSAVSRLKQGLSRRILPFFQFPDPMVGWLPFAMATAVRAARRHDVDVIYTTAPPNTTALVGLGVKLLTGLPLVSDFRDPWMDNTYQQEAGSVRGRIARMLERWVFRHSDRIINISSDLDSKAKERVPSSWRSRFTVISNGYDPEDFAGLQAGGDPAPADSIFRVTYTGCFYPGTRDPLAFLEALALVARREPEIFARIRVSFIGEPDWPRANTEILGRLALGDRVEFLPFLPHQQALARLRDSDLLLMIGSVSREDTGSLPGKMFEYLAVSRPILALVHEGESAAFVRAGGIGLVVNPEQPEEIASALLMLYHQIAEGMYQNVRNTEFLERFDRRILTARLARIFDELAHADQVVDSPPGIEDKRQRVGRMSG